MDHVKKLVAAVKRIAEMDPQDAAVDATVKEMKMESELLGEKLAETESAPVVHSMEQDQKSIAEQIDRLHEAAVQPAKNYVRITNILRGLKQASVIAQRPQNAAVRPRIAQLVAKTAGLFAEVDTMADLSKPLADIEAAVHKLYGPHLNSPNAYMFKKNSKGFHGKDD